MAQILHRALQKTVLLRNAAEARVFGVRTGNGRKIVTGVPDARGGGIEIREDAQDAAAARRPAGKRVNMKKIIALVKRKTAALFFKGTKTRKIENPFLGVRREKFFEEADDVAAV